MTYDADTGFHLPTPEDDLDRRLRDAALTKLGLTAPDGELDEFAAALARDAGEPYAMVNVFTPDLQFFVGLHAPDGDDLPAVGRTMPRDHGFCPEVVARRRALPLPDVFAHARFASNPVVDQIGIRTYAGAPLIYQDTVLGTVCFLGPTDRPRETGRAQHALINSRRDALMDLLVRRAGLPSQ